MVDVLMWFTILALLVLSIYACSTNKEDEYSSMFIVGFTFLVITCSIGAISIGIS